MPRASTIASLLSLMVAIVHLAAGVEASETGDGFRTHPDLGWTHGDNAIDLFVDSRFRWENWNVRSPQHDNFEGFRTRFGASYSWRDRVEILAQGQHTAVIDLGPESTGIGAGYFRFNGFESSPSSTNVKRLYLKARPTENSEVKIGRQVLNMGTWVDYSDPNFRYVKNKRMSQRLVGEVGWTNGTRSFDGLLGSIEVGGHHVHAFAARPTRGVFDINGAFKKLEDVYVGGAEWTAPPGTIAPSVDLTGFFVGYGDKRNNTAITRDVEIYTLGGSVLSVFDAGPGKIDLMFWGAVQFGHFQAAATGPRLDQLAGALLAEAGYQLDEVHGKPWLRTGVNFASGDGNPTDGERNTFFNILPTNHPYYGYLDQLALQNLIDWFIELQWKPFEKASLTFYTHRFWLAKDSDLRWFGTGVFTPNQPGYFGSVSGGSKDIGWEIDLVASYKLHSTTTISAGYSQLFGGAIFAGTPNDQNGQWAFVQLHFAY